MLKRALQVLCAAGCLSLGVALTAQEGHPLSGTWSGERTLGSGDRARVTLVMNWDGKAVTGTMNPGPEAIPLGRVTVDYAKWTVRIEAETRDASKQPGKIVIEGTLDDLGSWHRTLTGTWVQGAAGPTKGTFKLTRD